MKLRSGTIFDATSILLLLLKMHREMPSAASFPVHHGKAAQAIAGVLSNGLCLVVEDEDSLIVGSIGGYIGKNLWYSDQAVLGDTWFFVHPDHRKSTAADTLVSAFLAEGARLKIPVQLAHIAGDDLERKDKFFERKGLVKMGSVFFKAPE